MRMSGLWIDGSLALLRRAVARLWLRPLPYRRVSGWDIHGFNFVVAWPVS